jgi:hypothetical protein
VPAVADSYPSSGYGDELALAAAFLARAENSTSRWQEAVDLWNEGHMAGQNGVFNWDSKVPGVMVLFAQMAQPGGRGEVGGNLSDWKQEAERYFDNVLGRKAPSGMTGGRSPATFFCNLNAELKNGSRRAAVLRWRLGRRELESRPQRRHATDEICPDSFYRWETSTVPRTAQMST